MRMSAKVMPVETGSCTNALITKAITDTTNSVITFALIFAGLPVYFFFFAR